MAVHARTFAEIWLDCLFPPRCLSPGCPRRGAWMCDRCLASAPTLPDRRCAICGDAVLAADALGGTARARPARARAAGADRFDADRVAADRLAADIVDVDVDADPVGTDHAAPRCRRCLAAPPTFDLAVSPWLHAPPVTSWVHALKYERRHRVADLAGHRAATTVRPFLGPDLDRTIVVPVPTHARRRAERGIDVPARLAAAVAASLRVPCVLDVLERVRDTPPQVGTSRAERLANVLDAIVARRPAGAADVVVVDDVMTTGATGEACARALKATGTQRVVVLTVARATHVGGARS